MKMPRRVPGSRCYFKAAQERKSSAVTCPILRCSTEPSEPNSTVKGNPPPRFPNDLLSATPGIPANATGKVTGVLVKKLLTATS